MQVSVVTMPVVASVWVNELPEQALFAADEVLVILYTCSLLSGRPGAPVYTILHWQV